MLRIANAISFSYLQNNKTLKRHTFGTIQICGFSYLQNNKTLKLGARTSTKKSCFSYLQNNKTLKQRDLHEHVFVSFSYLQNNKTLKLNRGGLLMGKSFSYLQNNKTLKPQIRREGRVLTIRLFCKHSSKTSIYILILSHFFIVFKYFTQIFRNNNRFFTRK